MQNAVSTSGHAASPTPKICLHWSFVFGMSWHSIAGSSFTSDLNFNGFEQTNESWTASDSAAEDRPLGPNMSDRGEEQLSAGVTLLHQEDKARKDPERSLKKGW